MNLKEKLIFLEKHADNNNCDGNCDEKAPYKKCSGCFACSVLNEMGETLSHAVGVIKNETRNK